MAIQVSPGVNISEIDLTTVVPAVSTTTGALAGIFAWGPANVRTLVNSEVNLTSIFGNPTDSNYETFFTAANFLSYGNSLYVVRSVESGSSVPANNAYNAFANTASAANVVVLNSDDFNNQSASLSSSIAYLAKYPGALGNSLKISVCDSVNAFSQIVSVATVNSAASNSATSFNISVVAGANSATVTLTSNGVSGTANAGLQALSNFITNGDIITIGNTTIGTQTVKVTGYTVSANIEVAGSGANAFTQYATLNLADPIILPYSGTLTQASTTSYWEYYNKVSAAPTTSHYLAVKGLTAVDTLHVVVVDQNGAFTGKPGTILEVFEALSRATDAKTDQGATNYYKTVLNNNSNYIWAVSDRSGAASALSTAVTSSTNPSPFTQTFTNGNDGLSESTCSLSTITNGYDFFKSSQDVTVSLVLAGKARGVTAESTTPSGSGTSYATIANYIIGNIANYRKDCVAFISPAKADAVVQQAGGDATTNVINFLGTLATASSYAVMDSGYKYQYDKYNDKYRWVPLNGDIAGTCVRTDFNNDPWWSPAGFSRGQINNVIKLAYNPNQTQRDALYKAGVNPVVTFPGQGTILYGDKTLIGRPSAFDRINVRRLFLTVEKAISIAAQSSLFEFNDDFTRAQFVNLITPYLRDVQGRRGITAFKVVCDATNNTQQVIDSNQFVGDIYIQPARSINFIQLNFVAVRTGVDFTEIVASI